MNDSEIRRTFFYAMREAGLYDATIEWVAPYYRDMHTMMLRLALEAVPAPNARNKRPTLVLDIGCGTGAEAIPLLQANPSLKLVGLDLCEPMSAHFKANVAKANLDSDRYRLVVGDVLDKGVTKLLRKEAMTLCGATHFPLIISAFAIHHLSREDKRAIFALVHGLLRKGGVFLLGDLFNYGGESAWLTSRIFNWETAWIAEHFEKAADASQTPARLRELKEKWLNHYLMENKLDSVTTQLDLLQKVGFAEAGNPFRYWQVGLIWAKK